VHRLVGHQAHTHGTQATALTSKIQRVIFLRAPCLPTKKLRCVSMLCVVLAHLVRQSDSHSSHTAASVTAIALAIPAYDSPAPTKTSPTAAAAPSPASSKTTSKYAILPHTSRPTAPSSPQSEFLALLGSVYKARYIGENWVDWKPVPGEPLDINGCPFLPCHPWCALPISLASRIAHFSLLLLSIPEGSTRRSNTAKTSAMSNTSAASSTKA
jgi:hypothetical protein